MMAMLRREDVYNFWLLIDGTGDLDCEQCVLWVVCDGLLDNNEKSAPCAVQLSLATGRGMTLSSQSGSTYYSSRLEESQYLLHETFTDDTSIASDLKTKGWKY
jgi:hypothetical protein